MFGYFFVITLYGSEANKVDDELKDNLIKIQIDCNEAVILAHTDLIYEKDGNIHIMTKTKEGYFYSLRDE